MPSRPLVNRVTRYIGAVSFSAYLVQFAVLDLVRPPIATLGLPPVAHFVVQFATATALTIGAATIMYRLVERPGMAIGKRLVEVVEAKARRGLEFDVAALD